MALAMLLAAREFVTSVCRSSAMIPLSVATFFYLQAHWPSSQSHRVRAVVSCVIAVSVAGEHISDLIKSCDIGGEAPATLGQTGSCAMAVVTASCSAVLCGDQLGTSFGWWKRDATIVNLILERFQDYLRITDVQTIGEDIG